jgi:hypothetical protein
MVTNYELAKKIETDPFSLTLMKRGILSLIILDYKVYYERYLLEKKGERKGIAITNTADEFKVSEGTIRNAITFMVSES